MSNSTSKKTSNNCKVNNSKGLTTVVLPILLIFVMLILFFMRSLVFYGLMHQNALFAAQQVELIGMAQRAFYSHDLDGDGIQNFAPNLAALVALGLINFNASAERPILRAGNSSVEKAEGYKFKMKLNADRSSFLVTANPLKKFKDGEHQFRIRKDSNTVDCALLPKKKGKKVKWHSDLDTCLGKTSPKSKRANAKHRTKIQKLMRNMYCKLIPKKLRKTALAALSEMQTDAIKSQIFDALDENSDGKLSASELNLDGETLFAIAYQLYLDLNLQNDTPFEHGTKPRDVLVNIPANKIFNGEYGEDKLLAQIEELERGDVDFNKIMKKVRAAMRSC